VPFSRGLRRVIPRATLTSRSLAVHDARSSHRKACDSARSRASDACRRGEAASRNERLRTRIRPAHACLRAAVACRAPVPAPRRWPTRDSRWIWLGARADARRRDSDRRLALGPRRRVSVAQPPRSFAVGWRRVRSEADRRHDGSRWRRAGLGGQPSATTPVGGTTCARRARRQPRRGDARRGDARRGDVRQSTQASVRWPGIWNRFQDRIGEEAVGLACASLVMRSDESSAASRGTPCSGEHRARPSVAQEEACLKKACLRKACLRRTRPCRRPPRSTCPSR
jgi:hypothetical protein